MRLSVVVPVMNQTRMAKAVYAQLRRATDMVYDDVEFVIIDNGSSEPLSLVDFPGAKIIRNEQSTGVYPTFKQGFENTSGDIVAFFHSDLIVWEERWNERVVRSFDLYPKLGLLGFIGSNEIDNAGGRGLGTTSNFQGKMISEEVKDKDMDGLIKAWRGSAAAVHGKVSDEHSNAAVVDGCAMIIRRGSFFNRVEFPPHHFYDRLISTQMLEQGFEVGVLGIACDHISGQTVNQESAYQRMAYDWLKERHTIFDHSFYEDFDPSKNYDSDIYQIAEAMWLREYRAKGLVPVKVS